MLTLGYSYRLNLAQLLLTAPLEQTTVSVQLATLLQTSVNIKQFLTVVEMDTVKNNTERTAQHAVLIVRSQIIVTI